jgi:hypothetical protein
MKSWRALLAWNEIGTGETLNKIYEQPTEVCSHSKI